MPGVGDRRRPGSGTREAGEAGAQVREAVEMREFQGEAGGSDADRECDRVGWRLLGSRGPEEQLGSLLGGVPKQPGLGGQESRSRGAYEVGNP